MFKNIIAFALLSLLFCCSKDDPKTIATPDSPTSEEPIEETPPEEAFVENIFEGSITLSTQQEVNDFGSNNYTEVTGQLFIGEPQLSNATSNITDLTALSALNKATQIDIVNNRLSSLQGLQNVSSVDFLSIAYTNIVNLNGLEGLLTIYNLAISRNDELTDLNGLNSELTNMLNLGIQFNPNLTSLNGLNSISSINGNLILTDNYNLENLEALENLTTITGLRLENNFALETLKGLNNLNSIKNLKITGNISLLDFCDLQNYLSNSSIIPFIDNNDFNPSKQDIIDGNCIKGPTSGVILSDFNFNETVFSTSNILRNYSFSQDGMQLYMSIDGDIHHYTLPSPYNLSSLNTPNEILELNSSQGGSTLAKDVIVNQNGTVIYVQAEQSGDFDNDYFQQYTLNSPYSINSVSYIDRKEVDSKYDKMELSADNSKLYIAYHDFGSTIFREIREFEFSSPNNITSINVIKSSPRIADFGQSGGISYDIVDDLTSIYVTDDPNTGLTKKFEMTIQGDINSIDAEKPQSSITLGPGERIIKVVGDEEKFFTLVNSGGNFSIKEYVRN